MAYSLGQKAKRAYKLVFLVKGPFQVISTFTIERQSLSLKGLSLLTFKASRSRWCQRIKMIQFLTRDRVGKIRHLHVYIPLYLWECPGLFSDRSFHTETASVRRNKTRCVLCRVRKGLQTGMRAPQTASLPLPLHSFLAGTDFHCVLLSLVSPVKLIVAWSQTQPLDVYSHLGWAIKMMNELASCPGKGALRVDIDTQKIISLFRPFSVFNPVPQAPW